MNRVGPRRAFAVALAGLVLLGLAPAASAQTVIDSWKSTEIPPPPELKPVALDAAHTALIVLDLAADSCNATRRPTCARSLPHIQSLLTQARARGMLVVYTTSAAPYSPIPPAVASRPGDPSVKSGVDKFIGTDLEKILKDRGVTSVIAVGAQAHGALLYTASAAALRGFAVTVPVDGISADAPFAELLTVWLLKNAPVSVSNHVTLSRSDLITLR
jgi:nicotinamidase-related amidase